MALSRMVFNFFIVVGMSVLLTACGNSSSSTPFASTSTGTGTGTGIGTGTGTGTTIAHLMGGAIQTAITPAGIVTTYAGSAGTSGTTDGTGTAARFYKPYGITTDGTNIYVADSFNRVIRKVVISTGEITTFAGSAGVMGSTDGTGTAARFNQPYGITTDGTSIYVADKGNHTIRKIQ